MDRLANHQNSLGCKWRHLLFFAVTFAGFCGLLPNLRISRRKPSSFRSSIMSTLQQEATEPTAADPMAAKTEGPRPTHDADLADSSSTNSFGLSDGESPSRSNSKSQRPGLHHRRSSGTIIVPRDAPDIEVKDEEYDEGDARAMSPRRSSEELDRLEECARQALVEYVHIASWLFLPTSTNVTFRQAQQLQATLLGIVERVESVKTEHEKLEGGNRFLQS